MFSLTSSANSSLTAFHSSPSPYSPSPLSHPPSPDAAHKHDEHPDQLSKITVQLEPEEKPKNFSNFRKWVVVLTISTSALCVTYGSGIAPFTEAGIEKEFDISLEVAILSVSLFSEGLGLGPLLLGPLSSIYGRNAVYWTAYILFWIFTWPVAFATNAAVHLIFRFLTGFAGSAFLCVAGGTMSDMFTDSALATPMAVYTVCPFIGPVIGPVVSGVINQHLNWRWTYYTQLMWETVQLLALLLLVPETHVPTILKRKARRLRVQTGNIRYSAPIDEQQANVSVLRAIVDSCVTPFRLLCHEPMVLLLDTWNATILGVLYLTFQAFPIIFEQEHGWNVQSTGFTFFAVGFGMMCALATQPFWNWQYAKLTEKLGGAAPPPESRLVPGQVGGLSVTLGLLIISVSATPRVSPIVPIVGAAFFGVGITFVYTSTFTYLVSAYRPMSASALASNAAMRLSFGAIFPLFAKQMFDRLGSEGAMGLLTALTGVAAPLPFIFCKIGAKLRARSKYAVQ